MRKSRLFLFKSTSILISIFGIIMIISVILIAGYVGFSMVSSDITNQISSGSQADELATIQASYNQLESKFNAIKTKYQGNATKMNVYDQARLELNRAHEAIENAQSALDSGKSSNDVDKRIEFAKERLDKANQAYNSL